MIGKLKENRLKKEISKQSPFQNKALRRVDEYKKILFVSEEEKESFKKTINKFFPNAHIHHLYIRKLKADTSVGHNYGVHDSDFNLTGKLKNDKLNVLCKDNFDLIIDLSKNSLLLNYLMHEIPANLVVGRLYAENEYLHDLFVEGGSSESEFIENITRQINLLTQNGN